MATYRATVTIEVERPDGTFTKMTESTQHHGGDNPRFEHEELSKAVERTTFVLLRRAEDRLSVDGS